ncbi:MAG: hypothetical protein ACOCRX_11590 [Candidatus Woesearchaeota archaeon]
MEKVVSLKSLISELKEISNKEFEDNKDSFIKYVCDRIDNSIPHYNEIKNSESKTEMIRLLRLALIDKVSNEFSETNLNDEKDISSRNTNKINLGSFNSKNILNDINNSGKDFNDDSDNNQVKSKDSIDNNDNNQDSSKSNTNNNNNKNNNNSYDNSSNQNYQDKTIKFNESNERVSSIISSLRDRLVQTSAKKDALEYKLRLMERELEMKENLVNLKLKKAYEMIEKSNRKYIDLKNKEKELESEKEFIEKSVKGFDRKKEDLSNKEIDFFKEKISRLLSALIEKDKKISMLTSENMKLKEKLKFKEKFFEKNLKGLEGKERELLEKENGMKLMINELRLEKQKFRKESENRLKMIHRKEKEIREKEKILDKELKKFGITTEYVGSERVEVAKIPSETIIEYDQLGNKITSELRKIKDELNQI